MYRYVSSLLVFWVVRLPSLFAEASLVRPPDSSRDPQQNDIAPVVHGITQTTLSIVVPTGKDKLQS